MKLEEEMFVRTEKKGICKIKTFASSLTDDYIENEKGSMIPTDEIIKASHTLLGNGEEPCLIEPGDYVNGDLVLFAGATTWDNDGNVLDKQVHINHNGYDWWLREEYIKSILTKEQFEAMQYKVVE